MVLSMDKSHCCLNSSEKSTPKSTSNYSHHIIDSELKSDSGVRIKGYKLTEIGFQKIIMGMGIPRKEITRISVFKAQDDFINAFHNMKDLITNCLITLPKEKDQLIQLEEDIKNGKKRFRRGSYINAPTTWKPLKEDSETLKRINKVSSYFFDSYSDPYEGK